MNTLFQISTKRSLPDSTSWMKLPEPGRRRRGRRRSPSSGRTGRCRPSPRSCRPCRARRCDRPARNPASACSASSSRGMPCSPLNTVTYSFDGIEPPLLGQQVPRQLDRVLLEVVAEREVAEHLEERVMAQRGPDVVEIVVLAADAHALLRRRGARVVALLAAEEHVLELVHPGVGEQQRRIVAGQQGTAGDHAVAVLSRSTSGKKLRISRGCISLL